jgi:hypothetical protein
VGMGLSVAAGLSAVVSAKNICRGEIAESGENGWYGFLPVARFFVRKDGKQGVLERLYRLFESSLTH